MNREKETLPSASTFSEAGNGGGDKNNTPGKTPESAMSALSKRQHDSLRDERTRRLCARYFHCLWLDERAYEKGLRCG